MSRATRGHRLGESLRHAVSLRAVADEGQERTPFFFDRSELGEHVVALEGLDPCAKFLAGGHRFGAKARALGGLFSLAFAAFDVASTSARATVKRSTTPASEMSSAFQASSMRARSARMRTTSAASVASRSVDSQSDVCWRSRSCSADRRAASAASISWTSARAFFDTAFW